MGNRRKEVKKKKRTSGKKIKKESEEESTDKKQIAEENKQLKKVLIVCGIIFGIFLLSMLIINSTRHFEYKGIKFNVVKEGNIIFYRTFFQVYSSITGQHIANYNIYLRNDPRKLENIPFEGKINLNFPLKKMVIEFEDEFKCSGDGIIAIANFAKIFKLIGIEAVKDPEAGCDEQGRYMYIKLQKGNITRIEQFSSTCYNIYINNCEILKGTEKFIIEALAEFNDKKIYIK